MRKFTQVISSPPLLADLRELDLEFDHLNALKNCKVGEKQRGFKTVLGLTHVTVYRPKDERGSQIIIASKQLYANHYFEGSLALTWLVDAEAHADKPGCYLIYLNRSRMDALRGAMSWLKRSLSRGRIREGLLQNLQLTKETLEGPRDQP